MALASAIDAADAPIVLPYLGGGEQGALWDDSLRGAIVGLELGHGPEHLARGLVNGILAETVRCLQVLGEAGIAPAELRAAGGSAINESFRQDLADATGMVVAFPSDGEADRSALGAAQLLIEATGGDLVAESGEFRRTIPVAGRQAMFAEVFARHDKTRLALHPPNPRSSA
jgi:sugar (pentulose or hexulose) kinase